MAGHIRQLGHVYCLYTDKFSFSSLKFRLGLSENILIKKTLIDFLIETLLFKILIRNCKETVVIFLGEKYIRGKISLDIPQTNTVMVISLKLHPDILEMCS